MSNAGKYKLARQLAGKGAFAEVHLEIDAAPIFSVTFAECDCTERLPTGEPTYAVAVAFGVRFAMEKLKFLRAYSGNYVVRVSCIHTMSVDSTEAFVAYAASKAFFSALGRNDDPMILDMTTRAVLLSYEKTA